MTTTDDTFDDLEETAATSFTPRQTVENGKIFIPPFYEVWYDGVYKVVDIGCSAEEREQVRQKPSLDEKPSKEWRQHLSKIADQPVWLSSFARVRGAADGEELVELAFAQAGTRKIVKHWASRLEISDRRKIVALAAIGVPVRDGTAPLLEAYLAKCLQANVGNVIESNIVRRAARFEFGSPAKMGWMYGRQWIGPVDHGDVVFDPRMGPCAADHYRVHGSGAAWWNKYDELVTNSPLTRLLIDSTFAAPILRLVQCRTFIVHHWGASGCGKTALMKYSMAAWGDADELMRSFNSTDLAFVELMSQCSDLPVSFDELQSSRSKDLSTVLYSICNETPRARAAQTGGLAADGEKWRTMVRTTGEVPLLGRGGQDVGGQANRVIEIHEELLSREEAGSLHRWLYKRNFGHPGRWFIQKLVNRLNSVRQLAHVNQFEYLLQKTYQKFVKALQESHSDLSGRIDALAAIATASLLVRYWRLEDARNITVGDEHKDSRDELWSQCLTETTKDIIALAESVMKTQSEDTSTTIHERALGVLRDHIAANPTKWPDLSDHGQQISVYNGTLPKVIGLINRGTDELWIVPSEGTSILRDADIPVSRVLSDLRARGILIATEKGRHTLHRSLGKFKGRMWVLRLSDVSRDAMTETTTEENTKAASH